MQDSSLGQSEFEQIMQQFVRSETPEPPAQESPATSTVPAFQSPPTATAGIEAWWDALPTWKQQAVIGGAVGAMTFFWMSRVQKFVFG